MSSQHDEGDSPLKTQPPRTMADDAVTAARVEAEQQSTLAPGSSASAGVGIPPHGGDAGASKGSGRLTRTLMWVFDVQKNVIKKLHPFPPGLGSTDTTSGYPSVGGDPYTYVTMYTYRYIKGVLGDDYDPDKDKVTPLGFWLWVSERAQSKKLKSRQDARDANARSAAMTQQSVRTSGGDDRTPPAKAKAQANTQRAPRLSAAEEGELEEMFSAVPHVATASRTAAGGKIVACDDAKLPLYKNINNTSIEINRDQ